MTANTTYPTHSIDLAPSGSRPWLERIRASVGMVPNLAGAMANSPLLIEAFTTLREIFHRSSFSPAEKEVLALANALENECRYCQAIHATFAKLTGVAESDVEALRQGERMADERHDTLATFTRAVIRGRGKVDESERARFLAAGFSAEQMLEVVVGQAMSVLANYSGRAIGPEPDAAIRGNYR